MKWDPFLRVSISKVSGLVSVSNATGLETLNIAKKSYSKITFFQRYFVCCLCIQETTCGNQWNQQLPRHSETIGQAKENTLLNNGIASVADTSTPFIHTYWQGPGASASAPAHRSRRTSALRCCRRHGWCDPQCSPGKNCKSRNWHRLPRRHHTKAKASTKHETNQSKGIFWW